MCLLYWNDFNTWNVQETNTLYKKRIGYEILIIILIHVCTEFVNIFLRGKMILNYGDTVLYQIF